LPHGWRRLPCKYVPCPGPYMGADQPGTPPDPTKPLQQPYGTGISGPSFGLCPTDIDWQRSPGHKRKQKGDRGGGGGGSGRRQNLPPDVWATYAAADDDDDDDDESTSASPLGGAACCPCPSRCPAESMDWPGGTRVEFSASQIFLRANKIWS